MRYSEQDYRNMMEEMLDVTSGLTAWEMDFLDSLCEQGFLDENNWLFTEKQLDKFEQIYDRRLG